MRTRVLLLLLVAACAKATGAGSPREAFDALRDALAKGDGAAFYDLLDAESAARGRAEVRERRALLERGEPSEDVLRGMPMTVDELRAGDVSDTVKLFFPRRSHFFRDADWYANAQVAGDGKDGEDASWIDLRGADGVVRKLWFVREEGRWRFDQVRSLADIPR